jgi:regulator of protease activity HflC (stomatin/prohibitin superfamily)
MGSPALAAAIVAAVVILVFLASSFRVANEYQRAVVLRLGRLVATRGPGLYVLLPFIERRTTIDLRVVTADVEEQEAITKDNVPVKVDAVVWYRVVDSAKSVVEVQDVHEAVTQVALTLLRNLLGRHSLDDLLKEKESSARSCVSTSIARPSPGG